MQQNDYYESLFRRTTASYRAKTDKENGERGTHNRQPATSENRKALRERNHRETTTSHDLLNSIPSSRSSSEKKVEEIKIDARSLKLLVEKTLAQVLHDKYSQEFTEKDHNAIDEVKSPIRAIVEQILKEKLSNLQHSSNDNLRSTIEDIVIQVLNEKLSSLEKEGVKYENHDGVKKLNQDLQQKLSISKEANIQLSRENVTRYNSNKPLDAESLVQELLTFDEADNKTHLNQNLKKSTKEIEKSKTCIKRLKRHPMKKAEWQDPSMHDKVLNKSPKPTRSQSPAASTSAHSGRSKGGSSVLIRRSKFQGCKPNSDPVALYQYYKKEWEHFRQQIPGESSRSRVRWHVRQRLLDPE